MAVKHCDSSEVFPPGPVAVALIRDPGSTGAVNCLLNVMFPEALVVTGNALQPPGAPLEPGKIYESNGLLVRLLAWFGAHSAMSACLVGVIVARWKRATSKRP